MLRGFLNAMDTADVSDEDSSNNIEECAARYLCEGAEEAAIRGSMGAVVAEVARWQEFHETFFQIHVHFRIHRNLVCRISPQVQSITLG